MVVYSRMETRADGSNFRRSYDLELRRDWTPLFLLTWTVHHRITEESPLLGMTREELEKDQVLLTITVSGVDDGTMQRVHANATYRPSQLRFGHTYDDVFFPGETIVVDYTKFDDTHPC